MVGGALEVTYELFRPFESQEGNYTCAANNSVGDVTRTVTVDVRGEGTNACIYERLMPPGPLPFLVIIDRTGRGVVCSGEPPQCDCAHEPGPYGGRHCNHGVSCGGIGAGARLPTDMGAPEGHVAC